MKSKLNILLISQYFFPEQFSNNSIAAFLKRSGHTIDVVSCVPNYPEGVFYEGYSNRANRRETWKGIKIHRAWTRQRGTTKFQLIQNYLTFPITGSWTASRLETRADVSFVSMPSPLFQAFVGVYLRWRRKIPVVFWVQDLWPETVMYTTGIKSPLLMKPLAWVCGWLYRRANLVLVQSEAFRTRIESFGVPRERIRFYPNSAPESYVPLPRGEHPLFALETNQKKFRVMFAGNVGESQDFDTIIECASQLREKNNLEWIIVGSGRDLPRVKEEIVRKGLQNRFKFMGRHPENKMPEFFSQADLMIVTLKSNPVFSLTVPYKVQCYMACGKPIVAALDGEGARIIEQACVGRNVPASQPGKLAKAIAELMDLDTEQLHQLGANARTYYLEHYSSTKINTRLEQWLIEVANGDKSASKEI